MQVTSSGARLGPRLHLMTAPTTEGNCGGGEGERGEGTAVVSGSDIPLSERASQNVGEEEEKNSR